MADGARWPRRTAPSAWPRSAARARACSSARCRSRDSVRLELPPGAAVVRLPEPVRLESAVGRYALRAAVEQGALVVVRELTVTAPDPPAPDYEAARAFFEAVAADGGLAVLRLGDR